ncbi:MarR family winged helix-turn-helix transcriptional regulator [Streptomyces sp. NPDC093568]|uniref:MarR family winged helix-turn-helix transcriptional regulator n=1 Tax=Streptomyces sp. NPDC093568 TaxID=3366041 RepID=UPI0037F36F89
MQHLSGRDEIAITSLAETIAMDRTTLATNLKPLARKGLVSVESSASDRRARIVTITPDGVARMQAALPRWRAAQAQLEDNFGAEKSAQFRAILAEVLDTGFRPWAE